MSRLAAQTLDLALAHFPQALLAPGGDQALRRAAPDLADRRQIYFECRLAGEDRSVDVSQHFFAADEGPQVLADLAGRQAAQGGPPAATWRRLSAFAHDWSVGERLSAITEIGLEQDQGVAAPAIFAAFAADVLADEAAGRRFIQAVLPGGAEAWEGVVATLVLARTCGLIPGRMVGAMLSRDAQLRCMVRGLAPAAVAAFLDAAGWTGDRTTVLRLVDEPRLGGDALRLVLGFGPHLLPDCGLEVLHPHGPAGDAGRQITLEWLVEAGLADRERAEALTAWSGPLTPGTARASWPDAMIAADLAGETCGLDYFGMALSHFKLNLIGGVLRPAKAYLTLAPLTRPISEAFDA